MFEDLDGPDSGYSPQQASAAPAPSSYGGNTSQTGQPYGNSSGGYGGSQNQGGYNKGGGGYGGQRQGGYGGGQRQGGGFQRKPDELQDPYVAIGLYVEKTFPQEVKEEFFTLASKCLSKKMVVRINADDPEFIQRLQQLSREKVEIYLPWRNFNDLESKHTYNTLTANHTAQMHFSGWEKIPDAVKAMLAAQVRLVFGDRNNSAVLCVLTWSPDAASRSSEVSKETGRAGFLIKMASSFGFPVLNLKRPQAVAAFEKSFSL
jgi:hypothetical protein